MLTNDSGLQMESKIDDQLQKTTMEDVEETASKSSVEIGVEVEESVVPFDMKDEEQHKEDEKKEGEKSPNDDVDGEKENLMNKSSNGLEVAIMLPPPPVLVPFMATAITVNSSADSRPPSTTTVDKDEEEVLSLQVLSARSSTPYTVQGICCANANCNALEATTDAVTNGDDQTAVMVDEDKHKHLNGHMESKKYSRSDLLDIRNEMTIIRPECLEEARLQRLHFRKSENGLSNGNGMTRNKSFRNSNPPNDLMPAFFKRKASPNPNAIVYDSFSSNPFNHHNTQDNSSNNYRRIGSGRISSSRQETINWDYIPEEDPNRHQLPEFFNTKDSSSKPQRSMHKQKHELDDNGNYVKRPAESSFRSLGSSHSINSSGEERHSSTASSSTANNKSDEPEWFSCGPTSRLDTIELSGFNESDQQKIRSEMAKNKPDSNNNRRDFSSSTTKEKKHLAFQFDEFSSTAAHNGKAGSSAAGPPKMPASKFMPLFNAKKRDDDESHNSTQSLNELFMFGSGGKPSSSQHKDKLSTTEMPSVDEIEAKWRGGSSQSQGETTFNNNSENFKKMLQQLNQQQQHQGPSSMTSPPPPAAGQRMNSQQQPMNLFNNDNLSNFIKHRNLQQQLLQKQQQQAAFAQLQFNAILSRPDTQMLLLSLARGEISKHGLVVQLANPNLSQADREAISAALTFSTVGQFHQQMAINQNNQQHFIASQLQNLSLMQQQLNKSPIGGRRNASQYSSPKAGIANNNNNNSGGSSPRTFTQEELQSHANFILHNAMLKKKLEEQNLGLQKMLHLQSNGLDSMAGTNKNFNHFPHHQQQQQHHQKQFQTMQTQQQQHHQRQRKTPSNTAIRSNFPIGRRRSTSSSSSNTANSGNMTMNALHNSHLQLRRQLEQRRNTIATATVGGGGK